MPPRVLSQFGVERRAQDMVLAHRDGAVPALVRDGAECLHAGGVDGGYERGPDEYAGEGGVAGVELGRAVVVEEAREEEEEGATAGAGGGANSHTNESRWDPNALVSTVTASPPMVDWPCCLVCVAWLASMIRPADVPCGVGRGESGEMKAKAGGGRTFPPISRNSKVTLR
ncbi:hypothetical protein M427DRAFT_382954 [Gonapodya prolifera JEL478]|uniref:Uncharacterized protein n=1 Tax=Gonapodya prolifera (strain JEL478) TaxID=1344416 RepID=A0A139A9B4_GONPJ|nr:hypothetical protein M427DRAFT_382954 [Gonapodya prolifera JEL478]|eukprot:KXS13337.1 hypothetical protein M427DRAFT_382954 [Gonapodya prolifera JEL478]